MTWVCTSSTTKPDDGSKVHLYYIKSLLSKPTFYGEQHVIAGYDAVLKEERMVDSKTFDVTDDELDAYPWADSLWEDLVSLGMVDWREHQCVMMQHLKEAEQRGEDRARLASTHPQS